MQQMQYYYSDVFSCPVITRLLEKRLKSTSVSACFNKKCSLLGKINSRLKMFKFYRCPELECLTLLWAI